MPARTTLSYETQARLSVVLAAVGGLAVIGAVALVLRNFMPQPRWVLYNPRSMWLPMLGGSILLALGAGAAGLLVGLNSAGQKRNSLSRTSWIGFFLSAAVIALAMCVGVFFYFTRFPVST